MRSQSLNPCQVPLGSVDTECARAFKKLEEVVLEGLRHGFFEYSVKCEIQSAKKRRLVINAGVSHQFIIPLEELEAA